MTVTKELNGAYDIVANAAGTGTSVTPTNPSRWPDPAVVGPYGISIWPPSVPYTNANGMRGMVTAKVAGVLTIDRQIEGSDSRNIQIGDQMALIWGAQDGRGALEVGNRNLLRNPGFWLSQRGDPVASFLVSDGNYGPDGWYVLSQSNPISYWRVDNPSSPRKSRYAGVFSQANAVAQRYGCAQVIPYQQTRPLRGEPVRFEFMIAASPFSGDFRFAILEWTGTADSVTKDVVNNWASTTYTASNFFVATSTNVLAVGEISGLSGTAKLASIRATVGASATNLIVFAWTEDAQAQSNLFVITDCWLVPDTMTAPFMPRDDAAEVALCQRFYQKSYNLDTAPGAASNNVGIWSTNTQATEASNSILFGKNFPTRMRGIPTLTLYDFAGNSGRVSEFSSNLSVVTNNVTPSTGVVHAGESGFAVAHDPAANIGGIMYHWTANADL